MTRRRVAVTILAVDLIYRYAGPRARIRRKLGIDAGHATTTISYDSRGNVRWSR